VHNKQDLKHVKRSQGTHNLQLHGLVADLNSPKPLQRKRQWLRQGSFVADWSRWRLTKSTPIVDIKLSVNASSCKSSGAKKAGPIEKEKCVKHRDERTHRKTQK
jgi:hypothetical protein